MSINGINHGFFRNGSYFFFEDFDRFENYQVLVTNEPENKDCTVSNSSSLVQIILTGLGAIAYSDNDEIYVVGYTMADFEGVKVSVQSTGYLRKINSRGEWQWTTDLIDDTTTAEPYATGLSDVVTDPRFGFQFYAS